MITKYYVDAILNLRICRRERATERQSHPGSLAKGSPDAAPMLVDK